MQKDDVIYRQQAIDALLAHATPRNNGDGTMTVFVLSNWTIQDILSKLPSAQPEQKKGKWERIYLDHVASGERPSIFYCSSCNQCVPFPTNFCPACGSDNRQR